MKRLVVVGGGISGTAAAWTAVRAAKARGVRLQVSLLEKSSELGGKATTIQDKGWLFEAGPLGFMSSEPAVKTLAEEAGLSAELLKAGAAASQRYVWSRGAMRSVNPHPFRFASSGILGVGGLLRMALEPVVRKKRDQMDESVWDFAARRLGKQFANRLIHPMALGVFAGDAKALSLRSSFPVMAELERDHGSLIRAQIARARMRQRGQLPPRPALYSFRNGLQSFVRGLAEHGGFEVETRISVETVSPNPTAGFRISLGDREAITADAVILACDGAATVDLVQSLDSELSSTLEEISFPPVSVVALGFGPELVRPVAPGFGVLIPRGAGFRALGVTWDSDLFAHRSRKDHLLVRVLFGGAFDPEIAELEPNELIDTAQREIRQLFKTDVTPVFSHAKRWTHAIPQYEIGHADRVEKIERRLERWPGLSLAGNALYGTSFGKAAARGIHCGEASVDYIESLGPRRSIAPLRPVPIGESRGRPGIRSTSRLTPI